MCLSFKQGTEERVEKSKELPDFVGPRNFVSTQQELKEVDPYWLSPFPAFTDWFE